MSERRLLCLACSEESVVSDDVHTHGCPKCGDTVGVPADLADTVNIHITNHELRILTIWASNYADAMDQLHPNDVPLRPVVQGIIDRIGTQTTVPLTLSQEIADVRALFPDSEVHVYRADGTEMDI